MSGYHDPSSLGIDDIAYEVIAVESAFVCVRERGPLGPYERTFWVPRRQPGPALGFPTRVAVLLACGDDGRPTTFARVSLRTERGQIPSVRLMENEKPRAAARRAAHYAGYDWRPVDVLFEGLVVWATADHAHPKKEHLIVYGGPTMPIGWPPEAEAQGGRNDVAVVEWVPVAGLSPGPAADDWSLDAAAEIAAAKSLGVVSLRLFMRQVRTMAARVAQQMVQFSALEQWARDAAVKCLGEAGSADDAAWLAALLVCNSTDGCPGGELPEERLHALAAALPVSIAAHEAAKRDPELDLRSAMLARSLATPPGGDALVADIAAASVRLVNERSR